MKGSEEDSVFLDAGNKVDIDIDGTVAQWGKNPRREVGPFHIEHTVFMLIIKLYQSIFILSWSTAYTVHS